LQFVGLISHILLPKACCKLFMKIGQTFISLLHRLCIPARYFSMPSILP
jgi:hypothetical protein